MTDYDVEDISFEAGEDLLLGDICKLNADGEAVKVDSVEETNALGIVVATRRPTSGGGSTDAGSLEGEEVTLRVRGVVEDAWLLVEDTDGASGYDNPVSPGDSLLISGKSGAARDVGQALSSFDGTGQSATASARLQVGRALEAEDGSAAADTLSQKKVYVDFI